MNDLGAAALAYAAELGWPVFPVHSAAAGVCSCEKREACKRPGKHPRSPHGKDDATTNVDQIATWWERWPDANIGVATGPGSGIAVLDVDGPEGEAALAEMHAEVETAAELTSRGRHLFYRHPGVPVKSVASELGATLDVKGDGGYIIVAPSVHATGAVYRWADGQDPWSCSLAPFPPEALRRLHAGNSATAPGRLRSAAIPSASIPNGQRNATLARYAGRLLARGHNIAETTALVSAVNVAQCVPPLDPSEVESIVASIGRAQSGKHEHFRLIRDDELETMPDPAPLIERIFHCAALVALFGASGSYKSFVAVDMSCCLGTGLDWHGHAVQIGAVVYVCPEGNHGMRRRLAAWKRANSITDSVNVYILPTSCYFTDAGAVAALVAKIGALPVAPRLVVVDTLNRNMVGSENNPEDMSRFIAGCDRLRQDLGVAVLVVHHTGHGEQDRSRGHSSWPAALDTEIRCDRDGERIRLTCTKQKDAEEFAPLTFEVVSCAQSLVLKAVGISDARLSKNERGILEALQEASNAGLRVRQIEEAADVAASSAYHALNRMRSLQFVKKTGTKYTITDVGRVHLTENSNGLQESSKTADSRNSNTGGVYIAPPVGKEPATLALELVQ